MYIVPCCCRFLSRPSEVLKLIWKRGKWRISTCLFNKITHVQFHRVSSFDLDGKWPEGHVVPSQCHVSWSNSTCGISSDLKYWMDHASTCLVGTVNVYHFSIRCEDAGPIWRSRILLNHQPVLAWNLQNPKAPRFITIGPIEFSTVRCPLFRNKPISSQMILLLINIVSMNIFHHIPYICIHPWKIFLMFFQWIGLPGVSELDQLAGAIVGSGAGHRKRLIFTNHEVGSFGGSRMFQKNDHRKANLYISRKRGYFTRKHLAALSWTNTQCKTLHVNRFPIEQSEIPLPG